MMQELHTMFNTWRLPFAKQTCWFCWDPAISQCKGPSVAWSVEYKLWAPGLWPGVSQAQTVRSKGWCVKGWCIRMEGRTDISIRRGQDLSWLILLQRDCSEVVVEKGPAIKSIFQNMFYLLLVCDHVCDHFSIIWACIHWWHLQCFDFKLSVSTQQNNATFQSSPRQTLMSNGNLVISALRCRSKINPWWYKPKARTFI
jgi:hypothetical protein